LHFKNKNHTVNPWKKQGGFWFRGCLSATNAPLNWSVFLNEQEDNFAMYYEDEEVIVAATDVCASFPLIYSEKYNCITDDVSVVSYDKSNFATIQLLHYGYAFGTLGKHTLLEDWNVLLPGQYLLLDKQNDSLSVNYYSYFGNRISIEKSLSQIFDHIITRFLKRYEGRQIILPLSGGYDSRCLAALLKQRGVENVICVTYGRKESSEVRIAKKVAETLQYQWHFVEYNEKIFLRYFENEFKQYQHEAHLFYVVPYEQDYFALAELKDKGLIKKPFVVMSGFGGDFVSGCHYTNGNIKDWATYIVDKHYGVIAHRRECIIDMENYLIAQPNKEWNAYQQWLLENRKSKFLLSGMRGIESLGGEWSLPFFDREFMAYFDTLDYHQKLKQSFYVNFLFTQYFIPLGININKDKDDTHYDSLFTLKFLLKKITPKPLLRIIKVKKAKAANADRCNMNLLYEMIYKELGDEGILKDYNINSLQATYILRKVL